MHACVNPMEVCVCMRACMRTHDVCFKEETVLGSDSESLNKHKNKWTLLIPCLSVRNISVFQVDAPPHPLTVKLCMRHLDLPSILVFN